MVKNIRKTGGVSFIDSCLNIKTGYMCHHIVNPYIVPLFKTQWKVNKAEHLNIKAHSVRWKPSKDFL